MLKRIADFKIEGLFFVNNYGICYDAIGRNELIAKRIPISFNFNTLFVSST